MKIKLTPNSIQAISSADEYILAPEIKWERHLNNCHEFFTDDSGNKISKALVELATYPDVTWQHIYQVLTIIKLLHPKHEIDCQATFDRLTVPKRFNIDNMRAELELYDWIGDPERTYNPVRTDFEALIEFLEENELWFFKESAFDFNFDGSPRNLTFFNQTIYSPSDRPCRHEFRDRVLILAILNGWEVKLMA
jgi:hypothetical protein